LPLITTNCAVLGVATLSINNNYNFLEMLVFSFFSGLGFLLVMYIFSGLRTKIDEKSVPAGFRGIPIALITAAALAVIFARLGGII
jgi:electron transport complex protein RnfA